MAPRNLLFVATLAFAMMAGADELESAKEAIRIKEYATAAEILESVSTKRSPAAQYLLGTLYLAGLGVVADSAKARQLFEAAAEQGEPRAAYALASLLANEEPHDLEAARRWLDRAAELQFAPAVELQKRNALPLTFRPQTEVADESVRHEAFLQAVVRNDVDAMQALWSTNVAGADEFGRTPLHRAAESGSRESVAWLLGKGISIDTADHYGVTPLMLAASAKQSAALHELLKVKAKVTATDQAGNTALIYAARSNRLECIAALLNAGADLHLKNRNGWSAIDYALQAEAKESAELLHARGAVSVRQVAGRNFVRSGEILRATDKTPDLYFGWSDLAVAVSRDDPVLIQGALNRGVSANQDTPIGSLLMVAATTHSAKSVSALLNKGIDPRVGDMDGATPLVRAVRNGDLATVRALLAAGVRVDAHAKDEPTPLVAALRANREVLIRELLAAGADANSVSENDSALTIAVQHGLTQAVDALLAAGAKIDQASQDRTALWIAAGVGHTSIVASLLNAGATVDRADRLGVTPLMQACSQGRIAVVEQLIAAGADVRAKSKRGDTPLLLAAAGGHLQVVQKLSAAKEELDTQNSVGDTALIAASRAGDEQIVAALLRAGSSKKLRNREKMAAEDLARARGFERVALLIEKY